jgi:putative CocE/NonD family hydrolase
MTADIELVGTPVATLYMASRTADPTVYVYLEDVGPDGRVTYLTEGVFRALHRKPAARPATAYDPGPAPHTFLRADARSMPPGEVEKVRFAMLPRADKIAKGHRLRIAVAGADSDSFRRYSEGRPEAFEIHSTPAQPSGVDVQMRSWIPE